MVVCCELFDDPDGSFWLITLFRHFWETLFEDVGRLYSSRVCREELEDYISQLGRNTTHVYSGNFTNARPCLHSPFQRKVQNYFTDLKEMSRPIMLTGSYSIIIGLWFILKIAILIYGSRDSNIMGYIELFILTTLISFDSGLCPITLTSRNISLSSKIRKGKEREKVALYHSKMKARASDRRRWFPYFY